MPPSSQAGPTSRRCVLNQKVGYEDDKWTHSKQYQSIGFPLVSPGHEKATDSKTVSVRARSYQPVDLSIVSSQRISDVVSLGSL